MVKLLKFFIKTSQLNGQLNGLLLGRSLVQILARKSLILNKRTTTNLLCSVTNVTCVCVNIADKQYFKFGNSRFILGTETGREMAGLEWAGIIRDRKWVLNARDGKFSTFSGKNLVPKKRDRECIIQTSKSGTSIVL